MVFYALLAAFISYSLSLVYNLLKGKSLEIVFESSIRYFLLAFLTVLTLELVIYLYRGFPNNKFKNENKEAEKEAEKEA